jgi:hypothetical protein
MNPSPWPERIVFAILAVALYVGAAATWWLPRAFPG